VKFPTLVAIAVSFLGEKKAAARLRNGDWIVGLVMTGQWVCDGRNLLLL